MAVGIFILMMVGFVKAPQGLNTISIPFPGTVFEKIFPPIAIAGKPAGQVL